MAALLNHRRAQWYLLLVHAALIQAVTSVIRPTSSYRALELGVEPQWLGALSAGFAVLPLAAALGVGRVTDRHGERPVVVGGAVVVLVSAIGFSTVGTSLALLVACSALLGLGHLLLMVSEQSMVAGVAQRSDVTAFAHYTFAASAGQTVGPAALAALGGRTATPDTTVLFLSGVAMAVLLLGAALGLRSERRVQPTGAAADSRAVALLRVRGLPAAVVASLVVVSAVDVVTVYLPALGTERDVAASTIGLLLVLRALSSMVSRFFLRAGVARLGRTGLLLGGSLAAGAGLVALALPLPLAALAVAVALVGLGLGVGQPLTMSEVTLLAPPHRRATALSLRLTGNRLGQTLVPAGVGLVAGPVGAGGVLATTGVLLAAATSLAVRRISATGRPDSDPPPNPGELGT